MQKSHSALYFDRCKHIHLNSMKTIDFKTTKFIVWAARTMNFALVHIIDIQYIHYPSYF